MVAVARNLKFKSRVQGAGEVKERRERGLEVRPVVGVGRAKGGV